MKTLIDIKAKTASKSKKSSGSGSPTNNCCTVPPDGDPGPIKH